MQVERHWEHDSANEPDVRQVSSTGALEGNRTGEQEVKRDSETQEYTTNHDTALFMKD